MKKIWYTLGLLILLMVAAMPLCQVKVQASAITTYTGGTWETKNGNKYYSYNGQLVKGWAKVDGSCYYFDNKGISHTKWFQVNGRDYYCDPDKGRLSGWNIISGKYYYFHSGSYILKNQWKEKGNQWWYLNENGRVIQKISKKNAVGKNYTKILMIGDSRFYKTVSAGITADNVTFIAKSGMGYDWLYSEAHDAIMKELLDGGKIAIVFNLGVNDLKNIDQYIKFMNEDILNLVYGENCDLYYMSVNPVYDKLLRSRGTGYKTRRTALVEQFNKKLKANLDKKYTYIDMYKYLTKRYSRSQLTVDGLHYKTEFSQLIFNRCMIFLKKGSL